jgi:CRP-like cAMP-binding protein
VIGSGQYTSSAIAIEPLEATRIRGDDIRRYCQEHPEKAEVILEQLAASVSSRWQNADDQIRTLLAQIMRERN